MITCNASASGILLRSLSAAAGLHMLGQNSTVNTTGHIYRPETGDRCTRGASRPFKCDGPAAVSPEALPETAHMPRSHLHVPQTAIRVLIRVSINLGQFSASHAGISSSKHPFQLSSNHPCPTPASAPNQYPAPSRSLSLQLPLRSRATGLPD